MDIPVGKPSVPEETGRHCRTGQQANTSASIGNVNGLTSATSGPRTISRAGFNVDAPAFFQWLGLVPYLTKDAVSSTLKFMSELPQASVVFDYVEPFQNYPAERRASLMARAERVAARGEPWLSLFEPAELHELLRCAGFKVIEDLGASEIAERFIGVLGRDVMRGPGPHIVRAHF